MNSKKPLKYLYALLLLLIMDDACAQVNKISLIFNPVIIAHTGRSYGLSLQYDVSNVVRVSAGVKYHQNQLVDPVINNQRFRYRFYASNTSQKFGYNVGVCYFFSWKHSVIKPYLYCDITYFKMGTRALILTDADTGANTNVRLKLVTPVKYYNLNTLESNIGLGLECPFTKWFSINTRGGVGANVISNLPKTNYENRRHTELSLQYILGFQINL